MKFIDTFTEDDKKKLIKKAKLVFSVLKKGTITRSDGVSFSYLLGDNVKPIVVNGEIEIYAFISKIVERTYCPINEHAMKELIIKKFEHFNINAELYFTRDSQLEKYKGKKPWEEPLNEDIDIDKERNRVKTIHKAIRKGIVNFEGNRFRYELPEEYTFHVVDELHLQVTAIKFTFYNKDLSKDNGGGHGLPLKIWRIEGGKDVYLNKMLTGQDVGDISYNDEYGINNKTGVEYVNVKNKVRNRYRNFNINAIMTTPSDTVMVNEDIDKDRILKKGMTVNRALRKGNLVIKYDHNEVEKNTKYRYELPERCNVTMRGESLRMSYRYDEGIKNIGDKFPLKIWTDVKGKEILLNTQMTNHDYDYIEDDMENTMLSYIFVKVMKNVKKRYEHFNIQLDLNPYSSSIPLFLHEEEEDNDLTKKDRKKIELIYGLFKRGKYTVEDILYNYVLPDEYWIYDKSESGLLVVVLTMDPTQKMKLYAKMRKEDGNLYHREVPVMATQYASLYDDAKKRIKEKFERFNIEIVF